MPLSPNWKFWFKDTQENKIFFRSPMPADSRSMNFYISEQYSTKCWKLFHYPTYREKLQKFHQSLQKNFLGYTAFFNLLLISWKKPTFFFFFNRRKLEMGHIFKWKCNEAINSNKLLGLWAFLKDYVPVTRSWLCVVLVLVKRKWFWNSLNKLLLSYILFLFPCRRKKKKCLQNWGICLYKFQ